jgi:CRP-like cAMP-binding protein
MGTQAPAGGHPVAGPPAPMSHLLASLPARDLESLQRDLDRVRLDADRPLMHAHAPVRRVYFPESGLIALSVTMADGRTTGVTVVGSGGIVGIAAAIDAPGVMDATVLVPGVARSMSAERFRAALRNSDALRRMVDGYEIAVLTHLAQTVACNRLHSLDQRAARWLVLIRDRIGSPTFPLTQEAFADLLGVSRPAVSTVGARFAREGAAEFRRGTVHVLESGKLEAASCECLAADREILEPAAVRTEGPVHRMPRSLQRTALGMIRPEIRRAR